MIIDTEKLKQYIKNCDDGVDWETCPISRLNFLESRYFKRESLINEIEELAKLSEGTTDDQA